MKGIVVPGAIPQIAMLKYLKEKGIHTILADKNPKAIARPYADEFFEVSAMDVDGLVELAKTQKADFIVTCCADQVVLAVAEASERLGLPCYIDFATEVGIPLTFKELNRKREEERDRTLREEIDRVNRDGLKAFPRAY